VTILAILLGSVTAPYPSSARQTKSPSRLSAVQSTNKAKTAPKAQLQDSGSLMAMTSLGKPLGTCPLKHTDVQASVSGFVSRVTVKQTFVNPFPEKIEAIYTFPLAENGAVDEMLMKVGTRTIRGSIKKREEAKEIYERAKAQGQVASLLDQERTNIFTQSVANIKAGETIEITIRYVELLAYESGNFSFVFPMVVGPRFNPGEPIGKQGTGWASDTTQVSDASRITPPITPKGTRAGHDVSLALKIDSGVPIVNISSKLHEIDVKRTGDSKAAVQLKSEATIPNKDFVLTWQVASDKLQSGYLTYKDGDKGFLTLMILPPKRVTREQAAPKEMIFLIDCSGSQSGAPLEKAKETMEYVLDHMNAQDTFQVIAFSDHLDILFDKPQIANESMKQQAHQFVSRLSANGGTWMAPAVEKACAIPADKNRLRIVTFMTDGYVGNDFEIIGLVKKLRDKSRWFPFGTGNSVNRMLIDMMAHEGGGESEYVLLNSSGAEVGRKFYERIASPVLTDVKVSFGGLDVVDVYPKEVSDVWAEKPLYIKARYGKSGNGTVTISGYAGGKPYSEKLKVNLPAKESDNSVLASVWARARVDDLMSKDWFGAQQGSVRDDIKQEIIKTALAHHIMTQYTSFVAVEEKLVTKGGQPRTVTVPVEMPDGVSYQGVFGESESDRITSVGGSLRRAKLAGNARYKASGYGGGSASTGSVRWYSSSPTHNMSMASPSPSCPPPPRPISATEGGGSSSGIPMVVAEGYGRRSLKDEDAGRKIGKVNELRKKRDLSKLEKSLVAVLADGRSDKKNCTIAGIPIVDGKIKVRILVTKIDKALLSQLTEKGLVIETTEKAKTVVIGSIALEKLTALADILDVILIRPTS
jgi:Ca-activated chloride channel family protein